MVKNTAGQRIGAQMIATDGSAFTGSVTVAVTVDAGTQATGSVGAGACAHEGNGYHTYAPAQAETNGNLIAFTFTGTGAVPVTVQVFTTGYDPTAANLPANVTQFGGSAGTFSGGRAEVNTTHWGGTLVASANVLIDGAITAAKIATDAITSSKVADGFLTAAKFASGAFDAVWSVAARLLTAGTNIVLAKGTGVTGFNDLSAAQVNAEADQAIADAALATAANLASLDTKIGTPSDLGGGATVAANLVVIEGQTDDIGTAGAGLTALGDARLANLDAAVSSRLATAGYTAPPSAATVASAVRTELATELARIDAAITTRGSSVSVEAIKVITDALTAAGAAKLAASASTIGTGTVDSTGHTPTTTEFEADDITEATADHFIGRIVIFRTGALALQATRITDYALASGRGHFTCVALTEAPENNATFVIL